MLCIQFIENPSTLLYFLLTYKQQLHNTEICAGLTGHFFRMTQNTRLSLKTVVFNQICIYKSLLKNERTDNCVEAKGQTFRPTKTKSITRDKARCTITSFKTV